MKTTLQFVFITHEILFLVFGQKLESLREIARRMMSKCGCKVFQESL
jgi:hypothetical protein